MLDFMTIVTRKTKNGYEVSPKFIIKISKDLMIRGRDFYAVWDESRMMWSTDENDLVNIIDNELKRYVDEHRDMLGDEYTVKYMWDADSGVADKWHKYCQKQCRDNYRMLDEDLIFSNTELNRENYASKRLSYPLEEGSIEAYDKLIGTLYSEDERHKIEWAIGSIVSGDSKTNQKFMVLYGAAGTGKSTILNIIQKLFEGYYSTFDAKSLGSANSSFALEPFKNNPLVAIQHDGDLSKIEDNTRINSLVSHELMTVNEKFKGQYNNRFKCFLFMGTNRPVKITDGKSGILRRLIDVTPSGKKLPVKEYNRLYKQIDFELGAIAYHCLEVYKEDPDYYDDYIPKSMMSASNDFYNFVCDSFSVFKKEDGTTLKAAWEMYKTYVDEAKVPFPFSKRIFKEELKNYFWNYEDRVDYEDGTKLLCYYSGFRIDIFEADMGGRKADSEKEIEKTEEKFEIPDWLILTQQPSVFDSECLDCFAQYASDKETPRRAWVDVTTKLSDLDTSKLHYVKVPENHIVIDFDIKDENGEKSFEKNLEAASKWPPTYAEVSKGGAGIHLHYIYNGDPSELSCIYDENIEVKVFTGNSSLRRRLSLCNTLAIAVISSGLPLKGVKNVINFDGIKNEKALRSVIKKHLNKEIMGNTAPSVQMIKKCLDEAYASGFGYDVSDMKNSIYSLATSSSNQAIACIKLVNEMKFKSEEASETTNESDTDDLVFYDVEVFPNLFLVNYKFAGEGKPVVRLINPKTYEIENLIKFKLVGFNNRKYDNHMLYACLMGYNNEQLYNLSQSIITKKQGTFSQAYNLSYADVYDYASKKQSLKKWEIELGITHMELGLPWDEPVPEELWPKVAEYCDNDVISTEMVFNATQPDFKVRELMADLSGLTINDTNRMHITRIIFGSERYPKLVYTDLATGKQSEEADTKPDVINAFPGYEFKWVEGYDRPQNIYRGTNLGFGGYVYFEEGIYTNVALIDLASLHPSSIIAMNKFGEYTQRYIDIKNARIAIKHHDLDKAKEMLDGKLAPYLTSDEDADQLSQALKLILNSTYGYCSATFENPFLDSRDKNNIVALRGALFMRTLQDEVVKRGFTVAHIKTDSMKIPNATPELIKFCMDFAKKYGYEFEHEATYEKMCLVNGSTYIAKYASAETCNELYGYIPSKQKPGKWTATAKQFQVPYVFKTLFSKEPIVFDDMCETFEVKTALYLDKNENLPDVTNYEKEFSKTEDKYKQGLLSDTLFEKTCAELNAKIAEGHDYHFIGRVGRFCPIKPGCGGAVLYRKNGNKYDAATGSKGYRWLESEMVKSLGKEDSIDRSYYNKLVDDAVAAISQYGDFEWFVSDDPYIPSENHRKEPVPDFMNIPEDVDEEEGLPFNYDPGEEQEDDEVELPWAT